MGRRVFGIGFHVADNSDDLVPIRRGAAHIQPKLFSDRLLILQITMHKLLVDNYYPRRVDLIHLRECAAVQQRNARRAEVISGHNHIERAEPLVGGQLGLALDLKSDAARSACRQVGSSGDGLDTRNVLEVGNQIPEEESLLGGILVPCVVQCHAGGKEMVCLEAQILMLNEKKSAYQFCTQYAMKFVGIDIAWSERNPSGLR